MKPKSKPKPSTTDKVPFIKHKQESNPLEIKEIRDKYKVFIETLFLNILNIIINFLFYEGL